MGNDIIQDIWNKSKVTNENISWEITEKYLKPSIRRQSFTLKLYIWLYAAILLIAEVLCLINIFEYSSNLTMQFIQIALSIISLCFIMHGIYLMRKYKKIENTNQSVLQFLEQQYRFFTRDFEIWNIIIALSTLIIVFTLNTYVDNEEGVYLINNPLPYTLLNIGILIFSYGIIKAVFTQYVKEIKIYLEDLNRQVYDTTIQLEKKKIRSINLWVFLLIITCTVLLILTIWLTSK